MFSEEKIKQWLQLSEAEKPFEADYQCYSRDVFQAHLDNLYQEIKNPLVVAVAGEIGNNAFDHNLGSWKDIAGVYFRNYKENLLVIADRGQGVRATLSRIVPDLKNDKEAVETAFTKVISGRSPEQRGNGLKFVAAVVKENNWNLNFQSGNGLAEIVKGEMRFSEMPFIANGCVAILKY